MRDLWVSCAFDSPINAQRQVYLVETVQFWDEFHNVFFALISSSGQKGIRHTVEAQKIGNTSYRGSQYGILPIQQTLTDEETL